MKKRGVDDEGLVRMFVDKAANEKVYARIDDSFMPREKVWIRKKDFPKSFPVKATVVEHQLDFPFPRDFSELGDNFRASVLQRLMRRFVRVDNEKSALFENIRCEVFTCAHRSGKTDNLSQ